MKREDLSKLGLSDENVNEIMKLHGLDIEDHKRQLTEAQASVQTLTDQLSTANTTLNGLKELNPEEMKKSVGEWEAKYADLQKTAADDLAKVKFDYALDGALGGAKVRNQKALRALLDMTAIKYDEEKKAFTGLEEQLSGLKTSDAYLFDGAEEKKMTVLKGGNNKAVVGDPIVESFRQAAGLSTK
jgi:hypothetical protein